MSQADSHLGGDCHLVANSLAKRRAELDFHAKLLKEKATTSLLLFSYAHKTLFLVHLSDWFDWLPAYAGAGGGDAPGGGDESADGVE